MPQHTPSSRRQHLPDGTSAVYWAPLHWIAVATVIATFPLIFMGGLVTSHGAGLAVPDWPNSFGYNMFALPFNQWVGGVFYEHTHRLLGTVAGFCAILLLCHAWGFARNPRPRANLARFALMFGILGLIGVLGTRLAGRFTPTFPARQAMHGAALLISLAMIFGAAWTGRRREPRATVRWLSVAVLALVIFQGILGGLRVVLVNLDLAIIHACIAQAFLCLCGAVAVMTGRWWIKGPDERRSLPVSPAIARLATLAVLLIYAQLIVGALMRHYQAGLAIPDFPLHYGRLLPLTDTTSLAEINAWRAADGRLNTVTSWQVWLHFGHRAGALLVTIVLGSLVILTLRHARGQPRLTRLAWALAPLLGVQILLGVLTVLWRKPADIASAHVAVGALVLLVTFILLMRSARLLSAAHRLQQPLMPIGPTVGAQPGSAAGAEVSLKPA